MQKHSSTIEIILVILTGIMKILAVEWLDIKGPYIIAAILFWLVYIFMKARNNPGYFKNLGFKKEGLRQSSKFGLAFMIISLITMGSFAYYQDSLVFNWHFLPLMALYPIWGLIQQMLVQGIVVKNLDESGGIFSKKWIILPLSATLFAIVHLPYPLLTGATFVLGFIFTLFYLKWRNLWPLGLLHGWLGVFLYFWVLNRDPWLEVMSTIF